MLIMLTLAGLLLTAGCNKNKTAATTEGAQQTPTTETPTRPDAPTAPAAAAPALASAADIVGQPAPDFTLADFAGNEHSLAEYTKQGKIVIVDWFDYECGATKAYYSKKEFVDTMNTAVKNADDIVWLSVVSSGEGKPGYDPDGNKKYMQEVGKVNPTLRDPTGMVGKKYAAKATPTVYVVGKDGKVVYSGAYDEATSGGDGPKGMNYALLAVDAARKGQMPDVTSTKPFG
ncbi:MAG: redoxin family protein [bacterium]|nr:redoxin family protein [bacterium]